MSDRISEPERPIPVPAASPPSVASAEVAAPARRPGTGRFRSPVDAVVQRARRDPDSLTRAEVVQLQRSIGNAAVGRLLAGAGAAPNRTGLPDGLKRGVEAASGLPMDDVRVHYNSSKPAEVDAHAYARGTEIHLAPGQERHLPHEAWHVVQQMQGRVKATTQVDGIAVNDDAGLEREACAAPSNFSLTLPALDAVSLPNPPLIQRLRLSAEDDGRSFFVVDIETPRVGRYVHETAGPSSDGYLFDSGRGQFRVLQADVLRRYEGTGGISLPQTEPVKAEPDGEAERLSRRHRGKRKRADPRTGFVDSKPQNQTTKKRRTGSGAAPKSTGTGQKTSAEEVGVNEAMRELQNNDRMKEDAVNQTSNASRAAFIVQIPIKADANAAIQIIEIVKAYGKGSGNKPKVAFLFCLNSNLIIPDEILESCQSAIDNNAQPIGLLKYTWSGKSFPYGLVRNSLLGSLTSSALLRRFASLGYKTYVAIGDADAGERATPGGVNIFAAVEQRLRPDPEGTTDQSGPLFEPFLIGGGYRPKMSSGGDAHRHAIAEDMRARDQQSRRVNPLGPYFPEPNLFISGSMLLEDTNVRFGDRGAEFERLRTSVNHHITNDLTKVGDLERRKIHQQNNTHPTRDISILTGFTDLSVETDTERLVKIKEIVDWQIITQTK